jgi:hypothetical protein
VRQENKILETLAFIKAEGDLSIAALAGAQARHLPLGSSVIVITPSLRPEVALAADEFQRRSQRLTVLLLDASSFGGDEQPGTILDLLAARAVPVCLIHCGDDLPQTLAAFSRQAGGRGVSPRTQRALSWAA